MTISRRRFLAISAALACYPAAAVASTWEGHAFGAEIQITLRGPENITRPALTEARRVLEHIEKLFSLYDSASALSELNRTSVLIRPDPHFVALMRASDAAWRMTQGLFDPTIQGLWQALATGSETVSDKDWSAVRISADKLTLSPGQMLTFNGIAQGYATDRVTEILSRYGLTEALVNIGEFRSLGGPWRLGIADPEHGLLGTRGLTGRAIATSSASAHTIGGQSHIMHRSHVPKWSTVSVEADTATVADSLSTAMMLASKHRIQAIKSLRADVHRIVLIDASGDLATL